MVLLQPAGAEPGCTHPHHEGQLLWRQKRKYQQLKITLTDIWKKKRKCVSPSGAPSQTTKSAGWPSKWRMISWAVETFQEEVSWDVSNNEAKMLIVHFLTFVMSPWIWVTPGRGAMACRSTATIFTSCGCSSWLSFRLRTWLQLPGAAHRSTALFTPEKTAGVKASARILHVGFVSRVEPSGKASTYWGISAGLLEWFLLIAPQICW